ncbi:hypothetical protein CEXT_152301 [Caerostris extrusa]|uniref:Uncharacterized protein n=1 Tax=Caerostris extrusa TaxID=172846 RepID=A0AAV4UWN8_CAEEX|nr:hypothetical protein CEXT_152301 [Caerostris extrusa]
MGVRPRRKEKSRRKHGCVPFPKRCTHTDGHISSPPLRDDDVLFFGVICVVPDKEFDGLSLCLINVISARNRALPSAPAITPRISRSIHPNIKRKKGVKIRLETRIKLKKSGIKRGRREHLQIDINDMEYKRPSLVKDRDVNDYLLQVKRRFASLGFPQKEDLKLRFKDSHFLVPKI